MPLKLAGSVRSPCFGMGMMTLLVHARGAVPVSNSRFMMSGSWAEAIPDLKNSAGISSLPGALYLSFWNAESNSLAAFQATLYSAAGWAASTILHCSSMYLVTF